MGHSGIWWVDLVYGLGVATLSGAADLFGITYAELSVYVFGLAGPLALAAMTFLAWWYRRRYAALQERLDGTAPQVRAAPRDEPDAWTSPLVELERRTALREPPPLADERHEDEAFGGDFLRVPRREGFAADERDEDESLQRPGRLAREPDLEDADPPLPRATLDPFGRDRDVEDVRPDNDDRPFRRKSAVNEGRRSHGTAEENRGLRLDVRPRPSDRV